jgi:hypothetical protein
LDPKFWRETQKTTNPRFSTRGSKLPKIAPP